MDLRHDNRSSEWRSLDLEMKKDDEIESLNRLKVMKILLNHVNLDPF